MGKVVRWTLGGIVALLLLAVLVVVILGWQSPRAKYFQVDVQPVAVPDGDPEAIARGKYLAEGVAVCIVCHGEDLGGKEMSNSVIYGYVFTPNLTPGRGGIGKEYDAIDWVRAIRHGLTPEGRAFAFMPVDHYQYLTDDDLGALIAYLQQLPPVDNDGARIDLGIIPKAIINSGHLGELVRANIMDHNKPAKGEEMERGEYLAMVGGCDFCHGLDLQGGQGPEPGAPPGPNITGTGRLADWEFGTFAGVMLAGAMPEGYQINPMFMPWKGYRHMSSEDLQILFDYLRSLPKPGVAHSPGKGKEH